MSRSLRWFVCLCVALILFAVVYLTIGELYVSPLRSFQAMFGSGDPEHVLIVKELRAPRLIIAILIGASLAVAGAILQSVFRNPLAAPDLIGITGGAAAAAVSFLTFRSSSISIHWLPVVAMAGAAIISVFNYIVAWKKGVAPSRMILIGIGVGAITAAVTNAMLVMSTEYTATDAYIWLTGTIYAVSWVQVTTLLPWTVICLLLAMAHTRNMNVLTLSDDSAISVGNAVERNRLVLMAISVGLAGSAVAVGGVIGFVGLIGPHIARSIVGPNARRFIPMSALCGSFIVVLADFVGRTAFLPYDLPVGIFTAAIGAPFFIYLLYRSKRAR